MEDQGVKPAQDTFLSASYSNTTIIYDNRLKVNKKPTKVGLEIYVMLDQKRCVTPTPTCLTSLAVPATSTLRYAMPAAVRLLKL